MKKTIDLTRTYTPHMPVYPGDPQPSLEVVADIDRDGFRDEKVSTGMHTGTHIDAIGHGLKEGTTINYFPVDQMIGRAWVIDAQGKEKIDASILDPIADSIQEGDKLFFSTGWEQHWGKDEYFTSSPVLTEDLAKRIVELKVALVGVDMSSPDHSPYNVHRILFAAGIFIIENLCNLEQVPKNKPIESYVFPWKIEANGAPVRVAIRL